MIKRKIVIFSIILTSLLIGIIVYFQITSNLKQAKEEQLYQQKVESSLSLVRNNFQVLDEIYTTLTDSGFQVIDSDAVQYTRENGGELLIRVPKTDENIDKKNEIKNIANEILNESILGDLKLSIKLIFIDRN